MKKIIFTIAFALLPLIAEAQKPNLDKLTEKERNEYLLKTAYETVMKYAPEWYSDYKTPEITSFIITTGEDNGRKVYLVKYFHNPANENDMKYFTFSVAVGVWADIGIVRGLAFGDGWGISLTTSPSTRSGEPAKPFYRPNPYLKK